MAVSAAFDGDSLKNVCSKNGLMKTGAFRSLPVDALATLILDLGGDHACTRNEHITSWEQAQR